MKGKHRIIVSTKRLKYDFEIRRNLTVIRGDSATGKTTLVDMIREYVNNPSGTPVELTCDKKCYGSKVHCGKNSYQQCRIVLYLLMKETNLSRQ